MRSATHTNKPAVIALLHDADQIPLLQLQLVLVLWHVTVQCLETGAGREDTYVNARNMNKRKTKRGAVLYSHSTAQTAWLWTAAVGLGLLGNDERLFTGVGV